MSDTYGVKSPLKYPIPRGVKPLISIRHLKTMSDGKNNFWITFGIYGAVGIQLALSVVAGWFLGNYLDREWETSPWLGLTGLALGFVGGLYNLIRILRWRDNK